MKSRMGRSSTLLLIVFSVFMTPVMGLFWPTLDSLRPFALPKMAHQPLGRFPQDTGQQKAGEEDIPRSWFVKSGDHFDHISDTSDNQANNNPGLNGQAHDNQYTHHGHTHGKHREDLGHTHDVDIEDSGQSHEDHLNNHGDANLSGREHSHGVDSNDTRRSAHADNFDDHRDTLDISLDVSWHIHQLSKHGHAHEDVPDNQGNARVDPLIENKDNHNQQTDNHKGTPSVSGTQNYTQQNHLDDVKHEPDGHFKAAQTNDEPRDPIHSQGEHQERGNTHEHTDGDKHGASQQSLSDQDYFDDHKYAHDSHNNSQENTHKRQLEDSGYTHDGHLDNPEHTHDGHQDDQEHTHDSHIDDHEHTHHGHLGDNENTHHGHLDDHEHTHHLDDHEHTPDIHPDEHGHTNKRHLDDHEHTHDIHPDDHGHDRDIHLDYRRQNHGTHFDDRGSFNVNKKRARVVALGRAHRSDLSDSVPAGDDIHDYVSPLRQGGVLSRSQAGALPRTHRTDKASGFVGNNDDMAEYGDVLPGNLEQRFQPSSRGVPTYPDWVPAPSPGNPIRSSISNTGMSNGQIAREPWVVESRGSPVQVEQDSDVHVATVDELVTDERQTFDQVRQHRVDNIGGISQANVDISQKQLADRIRGSDDATGTTMSHVDFFIEMHGKGGDYTSRTRRTTVATAAGAAATTARPIVTTTKRNRVKPTGSAHAGVEIEFLPLIPSLKTSDSVAEEEQKAQRQSVQSHRRRDETLSREYRALNREEDIFWNVNPRWKLAPVVAPRRAEKRPQQLPYTQPLKSPQTARRQQLADWSPYYNMYRPGHYVPPSYPVYPHTYRPFYYPNPGPFHQMVPTVEIEDPACKWELIFKAVSGSNRHVYEEFTDDAVYVNGYVSDARNVASVLAYKNSDVIQNWNKLYILQVKVEILAHGHRAAWFVFNGIATTKENWWTQDRLIASSYDHVKTDSLEAFTTYDSVSQKSFVIRQRSTDCDNTCGYVEINDAVGDAVCSYQNRQNRPYFLYSKSPSKTGCWQTEGEYGFGDRFLIFAKLCQTDW